MIICWVVLLVYYRREFGDTFGSALSVMCKSLDASSLIKGWYTSAIFFEPTANWTTWILFSKNLYFLFVCHKTWEALCFFSGISKRWCQFGTFYSSAERLLLCPKANSIGWLKNVTCMFLTDLPHSKLPLRARLGWTKWEMYVDLREASGQRNCVTCHKN